MGAASGSGIIAVRIDDSRVGGTAADGCGPRERRGADGIPRESGGRDLGLGSCAFRDGSTTASPVAAVRRSRCASCRHYNRSEALQQPGTASGELAFADAT
jgi:hypothetical protein